MKNFALYFLSSFKFYTMSNLYRVFRKFPDQEQALELQQILLRNGIESLIDENSFLVDITFTNPEQQKKEFFCQTASGTFCPG